MRIHGTSVTPVLGRTHQTRDVCKKKERRPPFFFDRSRVLTIKILNERLSYPICQPESSVCRSCEPTRDEDDSNKRDVVVVAGGGKGLSAAATSSSAMAACDACSVKKSPARTKRSDRLEFCYVIVPGGFSARHLANPTFCPWRIYPPRTMG